MFVEAVHLPFCSEIFRSLPTIRDELERGWRGRFKPWSQGGGYEGAWDLLPLLASDDYDAPGNLRGEARANRAVFRETVEALSSIDGICLAAFSYLGPQTFVARHYDEDVPPVIRCHLGVLVPPGCTLDLDDEAREHANGRWLCFHGAAPHAAKNPSHDTPRVTLMIDVRRRAYPAAIQRAEARLGCREEMQA